MREGREQHKVKAKSAETACANREYFVNKIR